MSSAVARRLTLRGVALFYLLAILIGPVVVVCWRTFDQGAGHVWGLDAVVERLPLMAQYPKLRPLFA